MDADLALAWLIAGAAGAAYLGALVYGAVRIAGTGDLTRTERNVWLVAFLVTPVITAIVWFAAGPHPWGLRFGTPTFR